MIEISSRDNQHIKRARLVRDGRERDFVHVEGVRLVEEAINSECEISCLFVESESARDERIAELIAKRASATTNIFQVPSELLRHISDTENPQGIVAIAVRQPFGATQIEQRLASQIPLVLMLEETNNPANIGAIVRSAEAAGIAGLITTTGSADAFSPRSIRSSMGSCFRLPIWERVQVEKVLEWARTKELDVVGLAGNANETIYELDWNKPRLLIAGSEAHGISSELLEKLDASARIPMAEPVESLNLAAACGITMFEVRRQFLKLGN